MILSCQNISKAFGIKEILRDVSFHIEEKEKLAIVGINGAGKSTLLKIIMGQEKCDEGQVILSKDKTIGYLAQHQDQEFNNTIYEEMLSAKADVIQLEEDIRKAEADMKHLEGEALEAMLNTYHRLVHEFEFKDGYTYKSEIVGVLKGLGFDEEDFTREIGTLSGGQKTRVSLGRLLLTRPDIILLDEPTNHLDVGSISWLEGFLSAYPGSVIIVSHDRYFIDKIVNKIVEISNSKGIIYHGNYSYYITKRAEIRANEMKAYTNQQKEIKHQEEVITKLKSFNREKSIKRAESREKMLDKIEVIDKPLDIKDAMNLKLEPEVESGQDVLLIEGLKKSFDGNVLFEQLGMDIKRGDKVALLGDNGTGKTTILKIINKYIPKDEGKIILGSRVKIGYYDQEHQVLSLNKTIFQEVADSYPSLTNTKIRNTLAAFLFPGDEVYKRIGDLSGGERGRVSLAKLMLSSANLLILDEPTNHLDITSKEILENAIRNYTGTCLLVSHDRYFINQVATKILDLSRGQLYEYDGNYDYYLDKKAIVESLGKDGNLEDGSVAVVTETESKEDWKKAKEDQARERKRLNDLKKIEDSIEEYELKSSQLDEELLKPEHATNPSKLLELSKQKEEVDSKLEALMEEWEELNQD